MSKTISKFEHLRALVLLSESKDIYWHGTDSLSARKILKTGFLPISMRGRMDRKQDIRTYGTSSGSIASFDGTYFTKNLLTAYSGGRQRCREINRKGVTPVIFEAVLESRAATHDEDRLPDMLDIVGRVFPDVMGVTPTERTVRVYTPGGASYDQDPEVRDSYKRFIEESVKKWVFEYSGMGLESYSTRYVNRHLVEKIRPLLKWWVELCVDKYRLEGERASVSRSESPKMRRVRDKIYRVLYSQPARVDRGSFAGDNLRILGPVGFRGSHRILSAVQLVSEYILDPERKPSRLRVVYGTMSNKFRQGWEQSIGSNYVVEHGPLLLPRQV